MQHLGSATAFLHMVSVLIISSVLITRSNARKKSYIIQLSNQQAPYVGQHGNSLLAEELRVLGLTPKCLAPNQTTVPK